MSLFKRLSTGKRIHLGIAATALLTCYLHAQIARPVKSIVQQMQSVVSGRKTTYYHFDRIDDIGLMMRLVNQSGLNLNSLVDDVGAQISGMGTISQQVAKGR